MKTTIQHFEKRAGGKGWIHIEHLLPEEEKGMVKMYARVTIDPHASIGFHRHEGDGESYYIVSGKGAYNDNGQIYEVHAADSTWTPSGSSHGIENIADEPLVLIALVIRKP